MNPFIQNVSMENIRKGHHFDAGPNSLLIQITDPGTPFPFPRYSFKEIEQFHFLDDEDIYNTEAITKEQAKRICELLCHGFEKKMNVIVHCHAGICRSGAVVEVGVMIGFRDTGTYRQPNILVKKRLMEALGLGYYEDDGYCSLKGT